MSYAKYNKILAPICCYWLDYCMMLKVLIFYRNHVPIQQWTHLSFFGLWHRSISFKVSLLVAAPTLHILFVHMKLQSVLWFAPSCWLVWPLTKSPLALLSLSPSKCLYTSRVKCLLHLLKSDRFIVILYWILNIKIFEVNENSKGHSNVSSFFLILAFCKYLLSLLNVSRWSCNRAPDPP